MIADRTGRDRVTIRAEHIRAAVASTATRTLAAHKPDLSNRTLGDYGHVNAPPVAADWFQE